MPRALSARSLLALMVLLQLLTATHAHAPKVLPHGLEARFKAETGGLPFVRTATAVLCLLRSFPSNVPEQAENRQLCDGKWREPIAEAHDGRFRAWELDDDVLVVGVRHQVSESLSASDQWEAMGLWGRNFVVQSLGSIAQPGGLIYEVSRVIQNAIRRGRRAMGLSYVAQLGQFLDSLDHTTKRRRILLAGYSMGGAIASVVAIERRIPCLTVAANGIADVLADRHGELPSSLSLPVQHVWNLVVDADPIPRMDCQVGVVCGVATAELCANGRLNEYGPVTRRERRWDADAGLTTSSCESHEHALFGKGTVLGGLSAPMRCTFTEQALADWNSHNGHCEQK